MPGVFWKRQPDLSAELAQLRSQVLELQSAVRTLNDELVVVHDRVHRWMRRAVAAEGAVKRNGPVSRPPASADDVLAGLTGARRRIAERKLRTARPELFNRPELNGDEEEEESQDGVHS